VAASGRIALAKIPQVNPDVVTLDVEMPELSGLETLTEIRKQWPRLPVIMFSSATERGAAATLEALSCGATDYVTKPSQTGSVDEARQRVRAELVPKLKAFAPRVVPAPERRAVVPATAVPSPRLGPSPRFGPRRVEVLAIGVSTGGPNALSELLPALPPWFPVPIVVVQHMPPVFTRLLAERLAARCAFPVREGVSGARLEPGHVWLAPGDHHMTLVRVGGAVELATNQDPPENSCRPAVDPLFRSAAAVYGAGTLAVVLTGMGHDGLRGCEHVHERGGRILVQDQATSVVWGMPGAVADAGLAERILPLSDMASEILLRVQLDRMRPPGRPETRAGRTAVGRP
jgi:two-component system chemotaxis response regulator CheB